MARRQKLIVISADAMVKEDLPKLREMPNYQTYLRGGCEVEHIRSIYPTITYPVHTTIVTGCYPDRHGIYGNLDFRVGLHVQPWAWDHKFVKVSDLFDAAHKAGLSTSAIFWPVSGNHPSIDYLLPEYWTQYPGDTHQKAFARMGAQQEILDLVEKYDAMLVDRSHPECDEFMMHVARDVWREHQPDLMMIHPANIDSYRHRSGVFSTMVDAAVKETDDYIGMIMDEVRRAGMLEETNLVVVSDHGQLDITRVMNLNVKLVEAGLIRLDAGGEIADWDAYILSGGLSALVYLKDPKDKQIWKKTKDLLDKLCDEQVWGISRVFTEAEARKEERLGGDFSFVLESDGYSAFKDAWTGKVVTSFDVSDYRSGHATHGYLPEKGPQPVFLAKGPAFKEDVIAPWHPIVDEAPTFARVLGIEMDPSIDGRAMEEILRC